MKGAVLYGPRDVRFEELTDPKIIKPTDAVIRISATCVWVRPLVLPWHQSGYPADPLRTRVLRDR
jgi:hypothetical protein